MNANALDSPLEALAINYLSFGFFTVVQNIWTWVAVVAGAISFLLTIRKPTKFITGPSLSDSKSRDMVQTSSQAQVEKCPDTLPLFSSEKTLSNLISHNAFIPALMQQNPANVGTTKGKFSVYYYEDDFADVEEEEDDAKVCCMAEKECRGWEWEKMLRMRILSGEEMGWFRYQNVAAIDGNVVRLWDGCRAVSTSSSLVDVTW